MVFGTAFKKLLDANPDLNMEGFGSWHTTRIPKAVVKVELVTARIKLIARANEIEQVMKWLRENVKMRKTISPNAGSYRVKHLAEEEILGYVSNGQLIAAAMLVGYPHRIRGLYADFGMSLNSLTDVYNRIQVMHQAGIKRDRFFLHAVESVETIPKGVTLH